MSPNMCVTGNTVSRGWVVTDPSWVPVLADRQGRYHRVRSVEAEANRSTNPGALCYFIRSRSRNRLQTGPRAIPRSGFQRERDVFPTVVRARTAIQDHESGQNAFHLRKADLPAPGQPVTGSPGSSQLLLYLSHQNCLWCPRGAQGYKYPPGRSHCHCNEGDHLGRALKERHPTRHQEQGEGDRNPFLEIFCARAPTGTAQTMPL